MCAGEPDLPIGGGTGSVLMGIGDEDEEVAEEDDEDEDEEEEDFNLPKISQGALNFKKLNNVTIVEESLPIVKPIQPLKQPSEEAQIAYEATSKLKFQDFISPVTVKMPYVGSVGSSKSKQGLELEQP